MSTFEPLTEWNNEHQINGTTFKPEIPLKRLVENQ